MIAERWYDVMIIAGASGVWLFFAISGYVIGGRSSTRCSRAAPCPPWVPYALRRAVRIYPLYWVALTAFLLIAGAGVVRGWHYPLHYVLLQNLVPGREQAMLTVAWTLSIEVIFYIAVPLLALAVRRWRPQVTAEWLAAAVLASWAASIAFTVGADFLVAVTSIEGPWSRSLFPAVWQMFCPGLLVAIGPAPDLTRVAAGGWWTSRADALRWWWRGRAPGRGRDRRAAGAAALGPRRVRVRRSTPPGCRSRSVSGWSWPPRWRPGPGPRFACRCAWGSSPTASTCSTPW